MNRKKKIIQTLKKREKKQKAKLHTSNKPKYVSKADREKLALEAQAVEEAQASTSENSGAEENTSAQENA
ncbi:DUF2986 domain-containing protein [Enterovibrio makurazakiensis]|uniref:DUF2986 domain-containing protein n=1 Tax=Enterovibrio makurazakiensis TaxID=2910232 RepID=UPI003D249A5A